MKCEHCGKSINPVSKFCEHCGEPTDPIYTRVAKETRKWVEKGVGLCKKHKWLLPAVLGVVVLIIVASVVSNHKTSIDFSDYIITEVSGYDGGGSISVSMDYDKLAEAVLGKAPDQNSKKDYEKYLQYEEDKKQLQGLFSIQLDRSTNLSNGDFFLVSVSVKDNDIFKDNKVELRDGAYTKTLEVGVDTKKLPELVAIDPFDYIKLQFTGSNGKGRAEMPFDEFQIPITNSNGDKYTLTFSYHTSWGESYFEVRSSNGGEKYARVSVYIDYVSGLSNGDKVRVTLSTNNDQIKALFGVTISTSEKTYTVTGLNK